MSQSRALSFAETALSTVVGYIVAITSQCLIFPLFGIYIPFHQNLQIGVYFTVISLIRTYVIRRWFNGLKLNVKYRMVTLRDGYAVQRSIIPGLWFYHREMDPNAPVGAPAPLSVIKVFGTVHEAATFIGEQTNERTPKD